MSTEKTDSQIKLKSKQTKKFGVAGELKQTNKKKEDFFLEKEETLVLKGFSVKQ